MFFFHHKCFLASRGRRSAQNIEDKIPLEEEEGGNRPTRQILNNNNINFNNNNRNNAGCRTVSRRVCRNDGQTRKP